MSERNDASVALLGSEARALGRNAMGKTEPRLLLDADFEFSNADVSPDGRWLAYQSNESGTNDVFVRPFPAIDSGRRPVSNGGGHRPLWSRDGKEIFYLDGSNFLTAVAVERREKGLRIGRPETVIRTAYVNARMGRTYDVSPDGRRFLMIKEVTPDQSDADGRIVLVQNWLDELRRVAPSRSGS